LIDLEELPRLLREEIEARESMDATFENFLETDLTQEVYEEFDKVRQPRSQQNALVSVYGKTGVGKTYSALYWCGFLDPTFNAEKIFFDYNSVVYARRTFKPHTAVLVDEQARLYGVDMMRVSSILTALKEQLRKKSIHFFFVSPVIRNEYQSSKMVFECIYHSPKTKENLVAYKTNELITLGHIRIPHPLNTISKKLLLEYERMKDEHLEELTEKPSDEVEDIANKVIDDQFFKDMEKMYLQKKTYIPSKILVQIINKIFPEFNSSIIVHEIADRIRMTKEFKKEWQPR
jgi:hypothetical protein